MTADKGILGRYARVLDAVAESPDGLAFAEIVRKTGLPQGTAHRLIGALLRVGYIEASQNRKIYVLGHRLLRLLHLRSPRETVVELSRPVLKGLVERFAETAFVAKLEGAEVESVAMVLPEAERHSYVQPGRVMPLHAAASAKAIFAFQDKELLARALQRPLTAFTPKSTTSKKKVLAELAQVRKTGYAACLDELDPGVSSYACPIHVPGGVFYSVGLVGVSQRLDQVPTAAIVAALRDAADALRDRLSGRAPAP
ncbi:MAG: helix-turn-helix domain-containing protein [Alphaproteobacteria bacterium]|nr:helix-turn-helix domain-containing protein [Alphaproteobacteria bacterium]